MRIFPPTSYQLSPPVYWDAEAIIDLEMHERMRRRFSARSREILEIGAYHFLSATTIGTGIVATEDAVVAETLNRYQLNTPSYLISRLDAEDSCFEWKDPSIFEHITRPAILLRKPGDTNYGHWITELLPKVQLVEGLVNDDCLYLIPGKPEMYSVYRDSLKLAGVSEDCIYPIQDHKAVFVDHLIYPSPMTCHPIWKSPRVISYLENLQDRSLKNQPLATYPKNIFVSREDLYHRQLSNKNEVLEFARSRGFEIVETGAMSFEEQIRYFSQAQHIIGMFGTSMANALFAPRAASIAMLSPYYLPGFFYWDNACHKQQRYFQLHGSQIPTSKMDFYIDIRKFDKLLSAIECDGDSRKFANP